MEITSSLKQAVILAGGQGIRLRPLTDNCPKPMVLVNGRPFLEYLIEMLRNNGIEEIVLLLGYLPEKFTEHFGDGSKFGVNVKYSIGQITDESGTRIRNAKHLLQETFLLLYCDNYWPIPLKELFDFYRKMKLPAMMTAYGNKDGGGEYGYENNVKITKDNYVSHYYGKTHLDSSLNGIDVGTFILDKKLIDVMPPDNFVFQTDFCPKLIEKQQMAGYITNCPYYSITSPDLIKKVEGIFKLKNI